MLLDNANDESDEQLLPLSAIENDTNVFRILVRAPSENGTAKADNNVIGNVDPAENESTDFPPISSESFGINNDDNDTYVIHSGEGAFLIQELKTTAEITQSDFVTGNHDIIQEPNTNTIDDAELNTSTIDDIATSSELNASPDCIENGTVGKNSRKRKRPTPQKAKRKKLKEAGLEYKTFKGNVIPAKKVGAACPNTCPKECRTNFPEEARIQIHKMYYELNVLQKKDFILKNVIRNMKKRCTVGPESRRKFTRKYTLPINDSTKEVCKGFFLNTLDISYKFIRCTENAKSEIGTATKDRRGKVTPKNRTPPRMKQIVRQFIEGLPAVPSHYCRSSSQKKYLPEEFESLANIYRIYKAYCVEHKYSPVSKFVFQETFRKEYNIGIHVRKKDKCVECVKFQTLEQPSKEEQEIQDAHIAEKNAVNARYTEDQKRTSTDPAFICVSFDLEKVLTTPRGKSILFFYARKYAYYNLTFYESNTQQVFCYLWGEADGKRGSNEIASCLEKYLTQLDERKIHEVALYCDNCPGQQKNQITLTAISYILPRFTNLRKVSLNFLKAGHTMMIVDSVHAVIEKCVTKKTIYAPSEWATIIANARFDPFPYTIIRLQYTDFRDWKLFSYSSKWIPNQTSEKVPFVISDVQRFIFERKTALQYIEFFNHANDEKVHRLILKKTLRRKLHTYSEPPDAYSRQLQIAKNKYSDLIGLCVKGAIPKHLHSEYYQLSFDANVHDCLPETDEEDNI